MNKFKKLVAFINVVYKFWIRIDYDEIDEILKCSFDTVFARSRSNFNRFVVRSFNISASFDLKNFGQRLFLVSDEGVIFI